MVTAFCTARPLLAEGDMALLSRGEVCGDVIAFVGRGGVNSQALIDFLCRSS